MIKVKCIGHNYEYEIRELLKMFFKTDEIEISCVESENNSNENLIKKDTSSEDILISMLSLEGNKVTAISKLNNDEEIIEDKLENMNEHESKRETKILLKRSLFKLLQKSKNVEVPWGILTGIRPTKIVHELLEKGFSEDSILCILLNDYCIEHSKANLLLNIAKTEHKFIYPIDENKVSIYININKLLVYLF